MSPSLRIRLGTAALLATVAAVAAPSAALGDEVVLDNGRTLVGRVVSDDGTTLKLEMETGTMKIDRSKIREVRKKALPARTPGDAATRPASDPPGRGAAAGGSAGTTAGAAQGAPSAKKVPAVERPFPRTLAEQIEELRATELRPWPALESMGTDDSPSQPWKVAGMDGRSTTSADPPAPDAVVSQVWRMRAQSAGGYEFTKNGVRMMEWVPVWWDADRGQWWNVHPAMQVFQRYAAISKSALTRVCSKDLGAWVECNILVRTMGAKQGGSRVRNTSVSIADELQKLRAAAEKATGSASMGADAARCLEIEFEIGWEAPAGMIRLAKERASLLERLAAAMPAEPAKPSKR